MGTLDRYLHFRLPSGDGVPRNPPSKSGDTGDTGLSGAEKQRLQCRQRVSPPPATVATIENSVEYPAEVRSGCPGESTVPPVVSGLATPSGDTQSQAGSGTQGSVASVATFFEGIPGKEPSGDTQSQAGCAVRPFVANIATRPMRVVWQGWSERTPQSVKDCLIDLAEWRARQGEVPGPCLTCGDTLFWRIARGAPWRCRTCERPDARTKVQWLAAGGGPAARSVAREQPCTGPGCDRPACAWSSDGASWCAEHGREWLKQQLEGGSHRG